jgi:hypothetical protein
MMSDAFVGGGDADAPEDGASRGSSPGVRARNTRVAVDVLAENQRDLLFRGAPDRRPPITPLVEPFDDRRALINWWQAAAVRTFGYLSDVWPAPALLRDDQLVAALVGEDDDGDDWLRQRLLEKLLEATHRAHRDLEVRAEEWLGRLDSSTDTDDFRDIDPGEEQHIAMRPAFSRLDEQQAQALRSLWGGFRDRQALAEWVHGLPSIIKADQIDEPFPRFIARSGHARRMLVADGEDAQRFRERFAAGILLPAMATRAQQLRAGEQTETQPDPNPWNKPRGDTNE